MGHSAEPAALLLSNLAKGIPGIRYLDGGSRGAGRGRAIYVLFDDKLGRILEKWSPHWTNSMDAGRVGGVSQRGGK